jgi:glutathione synthase/RimK-type ligase-like ATP-grasp enzyme
MNTRIVVYPYKMASESGKKVATALDALRVKAEGDYHPKNGDIIFDWGSGYTPAWSSEIHGKNVLLLNHWQKVCLSVNKMETFNLLRKHGVPHPEWTMDHEKAVKWAKAGDWVCCRQEIEGMDGAGLVLAKKPEEMVYAKLYTKYKQIANEYRVYVFNDTLLDVRHKRRDQELYTKGKINEYVRTTSGGWLFCEYGFTTPPDAAKVAIAAAKAIGLDFAGVDIIQAKEDGRCYVLETNTAPYIGDHTVAKLAGAILNRQKEFIKNL